MYQPLIIIGAARSGTNMLRDLLVKLPGVTTWDCDEINYIWRYGNASYPHDELTPDMARPAVQNFIRRSFDRLAARTSARFVLEKTCANSLRVGYVDRVVPSAKYIFLTRDGRDVVASARKRWIAPLDLVYIAKKARYVPRLDLPYYASRYLMNRIYRVLSGSKRLAFWGPQFSGIQEMLANYSLEEVCAAQWSRSVERSIQDLGCMDPARVHRVTYEQFVTSPCKELQRLVRFLNLDVDDNTFESLASNVGRQSVGNWQRELPDNIVQSITPFLSEQLVRCGYETSTSYEPALERQAA